MLLNLGGKLLGKSNVSECDNHSNNASKCLTHQNMTFCYWSTIGKWFSSSCIFCLPSNIRLGFNRSSRSRCSAFHLPGNRIWSFTQRSRIGSSWCHHQISTNKFCIGKWKALLRQPWIFNEIQCHWNLQDIQKLLHKNILLKCYQFMQKNVKLKRVLQGR